MRISMIACIALVAGYLVQMIAGAQARGVAPRFVPGELIIGYRSADDADAAAHKLLSSPGALQVRGAPAVGVGVTKLSATTLIVHFGLPPGVAADLRNNPIAELAILRQIAARIKEHNKRVLFAQPNWIMSVPPQPGPRVNVTVMPQRLVKPQHYVKPQGSESPWVPHMPENVIAGKNFVVGKDGPSQSTAGSPNDSFYPLQWDYLPPPRGMNAIGAWKTTHGSKNIVVAVIDTGILPNQPDIKGSGHVLPGYDFVTKDQHSCADEREPGPGATDPGDDRPGCRNPQDKANTKPNPSWHGTHVAGTIGAVATNNDKGIAGVAWNVTILPIRVLTVGGGRTSDIIAAMRWAAGYHLPGVPDNTHPADIINMSLGGAIADVNGNFLTCTMQTDPAYIKAIQAVRKKGAVVVVAAGNGEPVDKDGKLCSQTSSSCKHQAVNLKHDAPAGCPGVISVVASNMHGRRAFYSNYGAATIMAPGGDPYDGAVTEILPNGKKQRVLGNIVSPSGKVLQAHAPYGGILSTVKGAYAWMDGTSMAAPHVSGALALLLSANPKLRHHPNLIEQALRDSAVPPPAGACPPSKGCGAGLLDAAKLVAPKSLKTLRQQWLARTKVSQQ